MSTSLLSSARLMTLTRCDVPVVSNIAKQHATTTEDEIAILHKHYQKLVAMAKHDTKLTETHSIEEAELRHQSKLREAPHWMIGGS